MYTGEIHGNDGVEREIIVTMLFQTVISDGAFMCSLSALNGGLIPSHDIRVFGLLAVESLRLVKLGAKIPQNENP